LYVKSFAVANKTKRLLCVPSKTEPSGYRI